MSRRLGVAAALLAAACGGNRPEVLPAPPAPAPEAASIELSLFLVGDAGEPAHGEEPVLRALRAQVAAAPGERVIVFLGDNIYPRGLPPEGDEDRLEAERRILAQIRVATETATRAFFIGGNHDWGIMGSGGWETVNRQAVFVDSAGAPYARFLPAGGCPGPEVVDIGTRLRLVLLDTQWWLHDFAKPVHPTSLCATDAPDEVADSLAGALAGVDTVAARPRRHAVVAGHHPIVTSSEHGGHFGWKQYIFPLRAISRYLWIPLPILGSYEPAIRRGGATNQDVFGPLYRQMRREFEAVFRRHPPLAYASGHDHTLQVNRLEAGSYQLVSGAGIYDHGSPVGRREFTRYASSEAGFLRLDFLRDGSVRLGVTVVDGEGEGDEVFAEFIY